MSLFRRLGLDPQHRLSQSLHMLPASLLMSEPHAGMRLPSASVKNLAGPQPKKGSAERFIPSLSDH